MLTIEWLDKVIVPPANTRMAHVIKPSAFPDLGDLFAFIRQFILRLEITPEDDPDSRDVGTCFIYGRREMTGELFAGTAKHLIPDRPASWKIQRFDRLGKVDFQAIFTTKPGDDSYLTHKKRDIGWFLIHPSHARSFPEPSESFPRFITLNTVLSEGSRVSWGGYAHQIAERIGSPHLCYFEGSVSASYQSDDSGAYLLDGHVAHGVSGGPVWFWDNDAQMIKIAGVITEYCATESKSRLQVPGFCVVEWINPLLGYMEWWNRMALLPPDHPDRKGARTMKLPYER
ncbi:MAG TPA: hypothetical protein VFE47_08430 [Tepidisphaeraceae bacterium]|nr:hypothetical protein [Tepidisphaeraceae bacterium]